MNNELRKLAQFIFDGYYSKKADTLGHIELLDDDNGVISQIDNMIAGIMSDSLSIAEGTDLSFISGDKLLAELLSRTCEQDAPRKTTYGDGMKTISVAIGQDETAVIAMHYKAIDLLRSGGLSNT